MNDNILSKVSNPQKKQKVRNYSFRNSKRLPESKMTEINGVKVPSMPGSCYHAIICALAQNKNKLMAWDKVTELTERYMKQYGGDQAWAKFQKKSDVKGYQQRIKENTHTLTRTGKDCYGYRLHEKGMAIYFFKDGAMLLTDGKFESQGDTYTVTFPDGRGLQTRYRGTAMTSKEYKKFLEMGYISKNGEIVNAKGIRSLRTHKPKLKNIEKDVYKVHVCVVLKETANQETAFRLEKIGLIVEDVVDSELIGNVPSAKVDELKSDPDVEQVDVAIL